MSVLKRYNQYLASFPLDLESLLAMTKDTEGLHEANSSYYGPKKDTKKHGSYGIYIQRKENDSLHIREGEWKNDKFTGKGSHFMISKSNKKEKPIIIWREGTWINNRMKGKGLIKQYNFIKENWEIRFMGNFCNDEKDGFGVAYFDKKQYEGYFKRGCFDGPGRLSRSDDNYQDGIFMKGQFIGDGIERRKTEFVIYDEYGEREIYSTPNNPDNFPSLYQNLIDRLCQKSLAQ